MNLRKLTQTKETIYADAGKPAARIVTRVAAIAVLTNPFAGQYVEDLSPFFHEGAELGATIMADLVKLLPNPAIAYGKAAIVGVDGEIEHGAAVIHPQLGRPIRQAIGGGEAIISSNVKIGGPGTTIDVPLAHKDNIWAFDYLDTMTISIADAPRPREIVAVIAISDGGRPHPRVGKGRI